MQQLNLENKNIDQQELDKFSKMAATWWDLNGDFKPIHQLNPLRLNYILQHSNGLNGKKVLDVGCGGGILSESMAKSGANVTGIDMSPQPLAVAKQHAQDNNLIIDYQQSTIEDFLQQHQQLQAEKFDVITCMEMLEHVPDPLSIIRSCRELLKPDGVLFMSTINRTLKAWALVVIGAEYILKMLPKGTHDYEKFIKPAELLAYCDQVGLTCQQLKGYHYNPLTGNFWLNDDVSANYWGVFRHRQNEV
ncbi:bifunctional 2-polyprenyl-6-hydroxyphenol methylase/3-demethylubiquinol 3-O-methyltransferase UbiG [Gallibacterium anatis]|uniref:Ubiquinone biosynthesis O-methyltransferase n=1 Tax=Gallibacterium anatis TaxID=750 RepID=A0AAX3XGV0_9PAST|nr:bifunctional 2-polyprenyl-6-hydroxyphenol methylase/3-demethylubiquinol 3-O-methyltransferase UbiG [Gallibacterium anatis]MDK9430459.1 bifunctional 2-polyprenyl-6-hydroxyphenol methylase/3-demethylubiquinol 3-O-methyltransferase UbiG [Gallibacterium anatis]WIM80231.1 bifunctional 2-polyprenyl-6-hydroxyphenol methylase/3-demethylubiquinol 3-O-methyltransferase UbiG [Gallibacterium anatis]